MREGEKLGMRNEELGIEETNLYTLIPLEDFKAVLGIDDREDKLARFCLVTSTCSIEQYCKRRFLHKNYHERIEFANDEYLVLNEYPVSKMLAAFLMRNEELGMRNIGIIEPEFYSIIPDCGTDIDIPFTIEFSPIIKRLRANAIKVVYQAGYRIGKIPADLVAACLELASWNFNRYKGRRIGMTGNIKGAGKEGEHFELTMPENVKQLLETYRRKVI
jgi:hypothetical protein